MRNRDLVAALAPFADDLEVLVYLHDPGADGHHWFNAEGVITLKSVDHGGDTLGIVARPKWPAAEPAPAARPDHTAGLLSLTDSLARLVDSVARLTDAVITRVERAS